ncbi:transmembrane protein [Mycobacteroides abscessus subsp. abscessus]|nr:transmembrane protein [Mycobacteroides abscessus subsp. abscessus]
MPYPVLMTYFLVYATGGRRTEKAMAGRPGFAAYQRRVSFFFPRPPKRESS